MSKTKQRSAEHSLGIFSRVVSGLAVGVGLSVILGWTCDVWALKSVLPGLVTMKANTALAFVMCGTALWLLADGSPIPAVPPPRTRHSFRVRFAGACAAIVAMVGLLIAAEYAFEWNLGIDQLLFRDTGPGAQTSHPGRPSPVTALNFMLLGAALLLMEVETRGGRRPAQWLALVVFCDALVSILGYAYGVRWLYGVENSTSMALNTTVLFLLIPLGLLCARPGCGWMRLVTDDGPGGLLVRRLLPAAILVPTLVGALRLAGERAGFYTLEFGVALFAMSNVVVLSTLVWRVAGSVRRADAERHEAERSLRASEEKLHLLVDGVADSAIVLLNAQGEIESWNSGAEGTRGYASEEIIGRNFACFYTAEDQELGKPEDGLRLAEAHGRHEEEGWRVRRDGSRFFADAVLTALKDSGGRMRGFAKVTRDITERKRTEEARRESEERLRSITDNLNEALVISTLEGQLLHWNKAALALFGFGSVKECLRKLP